MISLQVHHHLHPPTPPTHHPILHGSDQLGLMFNLVFTSKNHKDLGVGGVVADIDRWGGGVLVALR